MKNDIEILRAVCYTQEEMNSLSIQGYTFKSLDIEMMIEFKKIYEFGIPQLHKFIDKLIENGSKMDTYSILYYVDVLTQGPLGRKVKEYAKNKKYFIKTPDSLGQDGNVTYSPSNTTIYNDNVYPLGTTVSIYNKIPKRSQNILALGIKVVEDVFRSSFNEVRFHDNTLPLVDKKNLQRASAEPDGTWVTTTHGSYIVKDRKYINSVKSISKDVFKIVKKYLKDLDISGKSDDEAYRMFSEKKQYNPFDPSKNESSSSNLKVNKTYKEGKKSRSVTTDLMGDEFETFEKRDYSLKISTNEKVKEFKLNTNQGQLGN